jgi:hypothetical protein
MQLFEKIPKHYFESLKQDPTLEFQKSRNKVQFTQFALEVVVLEFSSLEYSLGVKHPVRAKLTCVKVFDRYFVVFVRRNSTGV